MIARIMNVPRPLAIRLYDLYDFHWFHPRTSNYIFSFFSLTSLIYKCTTLERLGHELLF